MTGLAGLRQPDPRSCGAASVVAARLLHDGTVGPAGPGLEAAAFRSEVLDAHRRLTRSRLHGRWQLPWPRALGTPPWAVSRELEAVTGLPHRVRLIRWSPAAHYDRLATTGGALYVGSRVLPRHVVLVLPGPPGRPMRCYQPARGTLVELAREEFVAGSLREAGWPHAWWSVSPGAADARPAPPASPR